MKLVAPRGRGRSDLVRPSDLWLLLTVAWAPLFDLRGALLILLTGVIFVLARAVSRRRSRIPRVRVLILGSGPLASKSIDEVEASASATHVIAGLVDDQPPSDCLQAKTVWLGRFDQLAEI